jgi:SAM-dependent methyltransferase
LNVPARSRTNRREENRRPGAAGALAVSVIVPAYNAADTIADTLASVVAQTVPHWEVIIVDDGSSDATGKVAAEFAQQDGRIRVIRQPNGGEAAARNTGIGAARHDWLLFLDADDWISPDYLERMTKELVADPGLDAIHCGSARVALDGTLLVERYLPPTGDMFDTWARRSAFPVHACVVRKSTVEAVGRFDTSLRKSADWDLWQRIARTGARFGAIREVLAYYRMRPQGASLEAHQMLEDGLRVLRQGHAPDNRVAHPHPDHANGLPPEQLPTQAFYLLCWCAGLLLGRNEDARPLLPQLTGLQFPELDPDAVAQCIFDAAPLPAGQPPAAWEQLWPAIHGVVDAFLVALEAHSHAPDLASRSHAILTRMSLRQSPTWRTVVEADDKQRAQHEETIKQQLASIAELEADRRERARALETSVAKIRDLEQAAELLERERADWRRLSEERTQALEKSAALVTELDLLNARLREEGIESEQLSDERAMLLADLRSQPWIGLGLQLGLVKPPESGAADQGESSRLAGRWQLVLGSGSSAHLMPAPGERNSVRIVIAKARRKDRWDIQLNHPGLAVVAQRRYAVHFRARADRPRKIGVGFAQAHAPWAGLGLYRIIRLTPEWAEFHEEFVATADDDNCRLHFDVGRNRTAVEVAVVGLRTLTDNLTSDIDGPAAQTSGEVPEESLPMQEADVDEERETPHETPAGRLKRLVIPRNSPALGELSRAALSGEVLARIEAGAFSNSEESILLGYELYDALDVALDVHNNRWSARRYRDLFRDFYGSLPVPRPSLDGATIVDLGCGGHNPYGVLFLFLMLGATRGIAIDLDDIQDTRRATRALADLAGILLVNPHEILGDYPVSREQMLRNIASFDLVKLQAGDPAGIDPDRLSYRRESVHALSAPDADADIVISNSFFEHIPRVDDAITEIARITRPGGVGIHLIDGSDHRHYEDASRHPLEFLTEAGDAPLVHGSNRIRPLEFGPLFERHGFEVVAFVSFIPPDQASLPASLRARLREPFRSMPDATLAAYMGKIMVRKL